MLDTQDEVPRCELACELRVTIGELLSPRT